jgi:hypothetical protein
MKKITCRRGDGSTYETVCYSKNGPLVIAKMLKGDDGRYAIIHARSGGAVCYRDSIAALRPLLPELNAITNWDRPFAEIAKAVPDLPSRVAAIVKSIHACFNEEALAW